MLGCNILPARVRCARRTRRPCERAFGVIRQLLFEQLPGYTGVDVADRGADPEGDACLTVEEMEHLIATWIVGIWQDRVLQRLPARLGPGRDAQPEHAVRRRVQPGRVRPAGPAPGAVLRAAARAPRQHPRQARGEDPRPLVRRPGRLVDAYRTSRRAGAAGTRAVGHPPRPPRPAARCSSRTRSPTHWHPLRWTGLPEAGQTSPRSATPGCTSC